jgi:hypothetical protein
LLAPTDEEEAPTETFPAPSKYNTPDAQNSPPPVTSPTNFPIGVLLKVVEFVPGGVTVDPLKGISVATYP